MLQYPLHRALFGAFFSAALIAVTACGRSEPRSNATLDYAKVAAANAANPAGVTTTNEALVAAPPSLAALPRNGASPSASGQCPEGMVFVEGDYCPDVEEKCLKWMDPPESRYHEFRCAEYAKPSVCKSKEREHKKFCIDATERKEEGSDLPKNFLSWTASKKLCESQGARLCKESEWQFACEGEEMRPYPYGWERDENICNTDIKEGLGKIGRLVDHRAPASAHPSCVSPFGVHDLSGNVEEWVAADGKGKMGWPNVMKGSWWIPSRHACRSYQIGHTKSYGGGESGTRCCKDPDDGSASTGTLATTAK